MCQNTIYNTSMHCILCVVTKWHYINGAIFVSLLGLFSSFIQETIHYTINWELSGLAPHYQCLLIWRATFHNFTIKINGNNLEASYLSCNKYTSIEYRTISCFPPKLWPGSLSMNTDLSDMGQHNRKGHLLLWNYSKQPSRDNAVSGECVTSLMWIGYL